MGILEAETTLRFMEPGDRPFVVELFKEFIRHEAGLDPNTTPFVQDRTSDPDAAEDYLAYCEHRIHESGGALVVAVHKGQLVGFMCWSIGTDGPFVRPDFRKVGEVVFVMASERCRGLGIGSMLMNEAERLTKDAGLKRLSLMVMVGNKGAVKLYERMGFESRAFKMLKRI